MGAVVQQGLEKGQPPALRRRGARGVAVGMLVAALATAGLALGAAARAQGRQDRWNADRRAIPGGQVPMPQNRSSPYGGVVAGATIAIACSAASARRFTSATWGQNS
ncbi:hypothetical protein [Achromobacter sp. AGC25]